MRVWNGIRRLQVAVFNAIALPCGWPDMVKILYISHFKTEYEIYENLFHSRISYYTYWHKCAEVLNVMAAELNSRRKLPNHTGTYVCSHFCR